MELTSEMDIHSESQEGYSSVGTQGSLYASPAHKNSIFNFQPFGPDNQDLWGWSGLLWQLFDLRN